MHKCAQINRLAHCMRFISRYFVCMKCMKWNDEKATEPVSSERVAAAAAVVATDIWFPYILRCVQKCSKHRVPYLSHFIDSRHSYHSTRMLFMFRRLKKFMKNKNKNKADWRACLRSYRGIANHIYVLNANIKTLSIRSKTLILHRLESSATDTRKSAISQCLPGAFNSHRFIQFDRLLINEQLFQFIYRVNAYDSDTILIAFDAEQLNQWSAPLFAQAPVFSLESMNHLCNLLLAFHFW